MLQPDLLNLARQGDPVAIALLLNRKLQPRGVTAKVVAKDDCLKILLISLRPLEQQAFVRFLHQQISGLGIESLRTVKVYGQQQHEALPSWSKEFTLPVAVKPLPSKSLPSPPPYSDSSRIQHRPPSYPKTSSGAIVKRSGAIVRYQPKYRSFWNALRSLRLNSIFPYQDVFSAELYRHTTVRLLLFLGVFPLLINLFAEQATLAQTAWLLGIYYASIWGVVLYNLIRPLQFSWRNTFKCVLFTTFVGIPTLLFLQRVPPFSNLYQAVGGGFMARMVGFTLGVGVLEEVCKALPVYLFLLRPHKLSDPRTSAFYGAMSGLGFAIAEGAAYSLRYAFGLSRGEIGLGSYVAANTIRFVSLPLFHAILAGIVGYFIGLGAINPSRQGAILAIGLAIAVVLHGLYNTFAASVLGPLIIGFSIALFISYLHRSPQMKEEMERAERE